MSKVVTRFAPSPTGFMHIGSVRTALYAWLWARKNGGKFILRIEDTDKDREVEGSADHIQESLKWLGLEWDEGPIFQSGRLEIYKKYAESLMQKGHAYLDDGAIRFKIPEKKRHSWHDMVYGDLSAGEESLEDFVLIKSDGYPTYNFAHIVDDIEMGVTHVMRGEEFIASTPKYLSLYEALETKPPMFATLPVILGPDGKKKLSKRDGAKDLLEYKKEGYLPDAFINFLALLGWNPGDDREIFTREELIEAFTIERIQKSGARMSDDKLNWVNKEHIKKLPKDAIEKNISERLPEGFRNPKLISTIADRISKWSDVETILGAGEFDFLKRSPVIDKQKLIFKDTPEEKIQENLREAHKALENINNDQFTAENIKDTLMQIANILPSRGELLHPVRYALSGMDRSPDPFIIGELLGKDETLRRIQKAI